MARVLVTGGAGYVGSSLCPKLIKHGHSVRVLDMCLYGKYGVQPLLSSSSSNYELAAVDLRNYNDVKSALKDIEVVIHLAAISNDPTGDIDETLTRQVNFDAVGQLVRLAKEAGVQRFINASSSSVFGIKSDSNINEVLEPEPITYYSKYKMLSEWIINAASSKNFCTTNVRPATICGYSPRQRFDLTVNKLTADAVTKRVITVHGGQQRRPNVGMTDMVNLYTELVGIPAEKINGRTFNFGFENLKLIEIAELIQRQLADLDVKISITDTKDLRDYHITSTKIISELNYKPVSSIKQEVQELRSKIESKVFQNIDDDSHYNMKFMKLERNSNVYKNLK